MKNDERNLIKIKVENNSKKMLKKDLFKINVRKNL
jgi:hypothetical protein